MSETPEGAPSGAPAPETQAAAVAAPAAPSPSATAASVPAPTAGVAANAANAPAAQAAPNAQAGGAPNLGPRQGRPQGGGGQGRNERRQRGGGPSGGGQQQPRGQGGAAPQGSGGSQGQAGGGPAGTAHGHPGGHGQRPGFGPPHRLVPIPPADVLQKIIVQGDAEVLVDWAEKVGKALRGKVQSALLRPIYGSLRRIEMGPFDDGARRRLSLLRPQLAYAVKRQSSATGFAQVLDPALKLVAKEGHLRNLIAFVEGILAYHREF